MFHERERESKKVCVFKCMCVCVHAHVYVCLHMCTCMNVSLYRGEMLQLPCPRVHETHVMQIYLILIKAWHVTSPTWAIKKNVEIGVLRFCWAGATKFSIFAFKMWWHHMYQVCRNAFICERHKQILHVFLIALFLHEGYSKWHVEMSVVLHLNFIQ